MENKKVKGSALYLEDGGLIFTSYQNNPKKSPWEKVIVGENGNIRSTNDITLKYFMNNFEQNIFIYIFVKNLSIMKKLFVLFLGLMVGCR